ncbi:signal peptide peptidase [Brevipalpus obovatus]|uniref:signal peptide peptidase n=1 Tax=Brevipalpus obovatus TaxID=246614 RepID=UPI003D9E6997
MATFQDHMFSLILDVDNATSVNETAAPVKFKPTTEGRAVAYSALLIMAVLPIIYGSFCSVDHLKKQKKKHKESGEMPETLSKSDAMWFPVIASFTLGGLYLVIKIFSQEYVNYLLSIYFFFLGIFALTRLVCRITDRTPSFLMKRVNYHLLFTKKEPKDTRPEAIIDFKYSTLDILAFILSALFGVWYVYKKHWIANNIFGIAFACSGIEFLSLNRIMNGCILLGGLFFYDVFWVFYTDVMVTVAQSFDAPIKLMFPQDLLENGFYGKHHAMLGLGDIVVPGIFIALLLRYDVSLKKRGYTYFYTSLIAYFLGLVLTVFIMTVFNHAQPALLYLVPACILSPLSVAFLKGDLKTMFKYEDHKEDIKPVENKKAKKVN